ncbi:NAD-dependent protein deacetylase sirtuin-3, mitochondrial isoform X2 [Falco rusticolus]|uniref:NAD-dependent protein deacetylase sirtuin-3, mitochondrial isoform X2 n=1 Tax=Falco rusticolus TaxID=120794 RepID=UPI0018869484|nr:NAD-dependent protein deacetylase sirtuin-3, mitochondrial isoform X2 [Falco rusticolus]XP_055578918.1 NAD-dependent protein deacetylase sirtuin-3, mitochondrial isoform X2 [Falco cherrug]
MERGARRLAAAWRSLWERGRRDGGGPKDGGGPRDGGGGPGRPARPPLRAAHSEAAAGPAAPRIQGTRPFSLSAAARAILGMGRWGDDGGKQKLTLRDVAELIQKKECRRVVVMAGAGISTPSGIPDFRSPGSGLYSNLEQYNIPYPEAIFELMYFFVNPKPFFTLAKELYPGNYRPNYTHYFLRLLHDKGLLLRLYTQNIDGLERAGCKRQIGQLAPCCWRAMFTLKRRDCHAQHGQRKETVAGSGGRGHPALQQQIHTELAHWGGGDARGSIQLGWKRSREALAHDGREAEGREAQMPSWRLALHMKAFLPETSEQLM